MISNSEIILVREARKNISLEEPGVAMIELGLHIPVPGLHRFFVRQGIAHKQGCNAIEQDRPTS